LNTEITELQSLDQAQHMLVFTIKKEYLSALQAIDQYRLKKRPLFLKIITFSIVRDYRDKDLEKQISDLQNELANWK
jgi:hypothetical protein